APHVDLVHAPAAGLDHGQELLKGRLDGGFLETWVEDDHHFVMTHKRNCPLWTDGHGLSVTGGTASARARHVLAGMQGLSLPAPEQFSGRLIPLPLPLTNNGQPLPRPRWGSGSARCRAGNNPPRRGNNPPRPTGS